MAQLALRNVSKAFGRVEAVRDVSLEIGDGEFVTLVGPSGCGKSTLLRMIAGLESVTRGHIVLDGEIINHVLPKRRDMAMVFQSYALYPHKTVAENMGFALRMQGLPKAEIDGKVAAAAEILGLEALLHRYPRELSGGQRQRVAMGRAIVRQPKVFLFDEPLSNLDAKLRVQMRAEIKELHQRLRTTTIYVTHDQVEAMTLADRVVIMNGGRVAQVGGPLEVFDEPADRFVAGFIGSPAMNFLTGTIEERDEGRRFVTRGGAVLELPSRAAATPSGPAIYGIRPTSITFGEGGLPGRVSIVEPTGTETLVKVTVGDDPLIALVQGRLCVASGDAVGVHLDHRAAHVFPPD